MNAYWYSIQWGFKPRLNKVKASGGCHNFQRKFIERGTIKSEASVSSFLHCKH
ncbi:hypothetical protein [Siminovitchia terrae]|uniref:hypothetical protein n=1 Tax=Siminovitchia terrae TaxID=1914933 RepID=UPI00163B8EE7|nr:hypothetical protein [Siminovitchia terrae]